MKVMEEGVLQASETYFHTPSELAKKLYFYLRCTGRYQCDGHYAVRRDQFDSFLLLYVERGNGYVVLDGQEKPLTEGSLLLLDCYRPHAYGTHSGWSILWTHFDGLPARAYYDEIKLNHSTCVMLQDPYSVRRSLEKIFHMFHHEMRVREALVSKYIVNVLTEMLTFSVENEGAVGCDMEEVLTYIAQNLDQPLTLEDLAKTASLSPYYFSRVFKREIGFTPHQYLVYARVNAAKFYLKTTNFPSKEIAIRCGFTSESSFCTVFKRIVNLTPQAYRAQGL